MNTGDIVEYLLSGPLVLEEPGLQQISLANCWRDAACCSWKGAGQLVSVHASATCCHIDDIQHSCLMHGDCWLEDVCSEATWLVLTCLCRRGAAGVASAPGWWPNFSTCGCL